MPYVFPDSNVLHRVMDGDVGRKLVAKLDGKGLTGLAFWDHPPIGLNLFVASHLYRMGLMEVTMATLSWVFVMLAYLVLITYVPAISLWLPHLLYGGH